MSEYQFVHFIAVDRPLDDAQLEFMQKQSSRAEITRREFTNEYHFGDFRGNALEMMRHGFDLHVHFANFGIRKLMFRLPYGFPDRDKVLKPYLLRHNLEWMPDKVGEGGVLSIHPDADAGHWDDCFSDLEELLTDLIPVREMLMDGDLRPLYLGWLACESSDRVEPPIPAGLGVLPAPLKLLASFYELSDDLLQVAAEQSDSIKEPIAAPLQIQAWLRKKSETQRLQLLESLLADETGHVRADVIQSIRKTVKSPAWPVRAGTRTINDLQTLAQACSQVRLQKDAQIKAQQRMKRLAVMSKNPDVTIKEIFTLVAMRSTAKYREAVELLCDLREALGPEQGPKLTASVAADLRKNFPRTNGLVAQLRQHGFLTK